MNSFLKKLLDKSRRVTKGKKKKRPGIQYQKGEDKLQVDDKGRSKLIAL